MSVSVCACVCCNSFCFSCYSLCFGRFGLDVITANCSSGCDANVCGVVSATITVDPVIDATLWDSNACLAPAAPCLERKPELCASTDADSDGISDLDDACPLSVEISSTLDDGYFECSQCPAPCPYVQSVIAGSSPYKFICFAGVMFSCRFVHLLLIDSTLQLRSLLLLTGAL